MTFAQELKEELSQIAVDRTEMLAEADAMLRISTSFVMQRTGSFLEFSTMNPKIARRFYVNIKELYHSEMKIFIKKQSNLKKQNVYLVHVLDHVTEIMESHHLLSALSVEEHVYESTEETQRAYLRGAFMAGGSLNNPSKSYHLEIACQNESEIFFLQHLLNHFGLNAKIAKRRTLLLVYIKDAQAISDFLNLMDANTTMMSFEDIRIRRDYNTNINRVINCEVANEMKTIDAANIQLKYIQVIETYLTKEKIPEKIYYVMNLRKKNPQSNLLDLSEEAQKDGYTLTKSCLNHRFRKIKEMAEELEELHSEK